MNDKIKKYLLPNIPYMLALWFFLKLGTAYRIAAGADFGTKLIGTMTTINTAFGTLAPGFNGFDWLVGIIGVALLRLVIYYKVKKVKNSERTWNTARRVGERKRT